MQSSAAATPNQGPRSSADFVLTAPDTRGNQQIVERIHLTSPSQMLASDTISMAPVFNSPAAGLHVPGQESGLRNPVADASQLPAAPALHRPTEAWHDSSMPAETSVNPPREAELLVMRCPDAHNDVPDSISEQTAAGTPPSPAPLEQQDNVGNAGTLSH